MKSVVGHLRRAALLGGGGLTDGQLLEGFLARRDEAAFEALLRRHGPMVLGVCRRLLRHEQDAEDAFQATFLVLARKAAAVRPRDLVGAWLHGVAYRTALKARTMAARRRDRERRASVKPTAETTAAGDWEELLPLLDQELSHLPEKYRLPVVLCDLEGRTRRDVAAQLKVPEGTLSGRLTTARRLLARRLARYGLAVSGSAVPSALSRKPASACVPSVLQRSTLSAAVQAAGGGFTAGAVPARVVALTEGVIKTMFLLKLRTFVAVAVVALAGAGVVGLAYRTTAAEPTRTTAAAAAADDLEALRLEVEALRKSLQATRERVKTLEEEVKGLKAAPRAQVGDVRLEDLTTGRLILGTTTTSAGGLTGSIILNERNFDVNPLAEADAALKKLHANPDDRQAADALEKALQQLRQRKKPGGTTTADPMKP